MVRFWRVCSVLRMVRGVMGVLSDVVVLFGLVVDDYVVFVYGFLYILYVEIVFW